MSHLLMETGQLEFAAVLKILRARAEWWLQEQLYSSMNLPCEPCMVHCCLHWCALYQEHREMRNHLSDNSETQMTIVKPPPVQEMNSDDRKQESASSSSPSPSAASSGKDENTKLEIQPV
ncbi:hypothetical protein CRYUN_Cryun23aG0155700 [Craigia yunnanensis]